MFKVGINSAPRITPAEVTETQENQQQNVQEQIAPPQAKPVSAASTSIRSEAMFSTTAMRAQLTQQLARNEPMKSNPESLQNIGTVDLQSPLTQSEADQQINNQPTYVKPFSGRDVSRWAYLPQTLNTGSGDDQVDINMGGDGLVHVNVNGKEAWSGTYKKFQSLTINTGDGNDKVTNNVDGATILTGKGDDLVNNQSARTLIDTGEGQDSVTSKGEENQILTGDGEDFVRSAGDKNTINTGSGNDKVKVEGSHNSIRTEDGVDEVELNDQYVPREGYYGERRVPSEYNNVDTGGDNDLVFSSVDHATIQTGEGNDQVINSGDNARIFTGDGEDWVENTGRGAMIDTGAGDDRIKNDAYNRITPELPGTVIKTGDGNDMVTVTGNEDEWVRSASNDSDPRRGGRYIEANPVIVETGEGSDTVMSPDNSRIIIDGEEVGGH